ncbi:MAG TPA: serine O-acetyltransferase [Clostridia bacterium]|nr:serine O-acetyltransferase [Clostridia bacterium]
MWKEIKADLNAALARDPAARSKWEVILTYSGFRALVLYRYAHWFYVRKHHLIAKLISARAKKKTGIEIHPGAVIGSGIFIDHGTGVVIGETTEIGNNVTIYQGVTLGGTGKDVGKRHPTLEDDVMVSAGAKVLGPVVIGKGSKIGAGSVVLKNVPPYCTVVGVPGRVVRRFGEKYVDEMDQKLPDPVLEEFARLNKRISKLEDQLGIRTCRYSIAQTDENPIPAENPCPVDKQE